MRLFREKQFEHLGLGSVDLLGAVANIEDIGYCNKTQSIDVISGVYVSIEADFNEAKSFFYHYGILHLLKLLYHDFCVSGSWVAFENPGFSGEPYILEKGLYANPEDWGALDFKISSIQPILHVRKLVTGHIFLYIKFKIHFPNKLDRAEVNSPVFFFFYRKH